MENNKEKIEYKNIYELKKGHIDEIDWHKGYKIVFEHSLNIFHKTNNLYTVCKMGRVFPGPIENVKKQIDSMFEEYSGY